MASVEKAEEVAQVEAPEAPEAPQGYQYVHIDPAIQRRVVRKLDWHIMPLVMALCKLRSMSSPSIHTSLANRTTQTWRPSSTAPISGMLRRLV